MNCLLLLSSVTLAFATGTPVALPCPPGWEKSDSLCYKLYTEPKGWYDARDTCRGEGGELATVTSNDQNNILWNLAKKANADVWFGLNKFNKKKSFEWSCKKKISFSNWHKKAKLSNSCGVVALSLGSWFDLACENKRPFVCATPSGKYKPGFIELSSPNSKCVDIEPKSGNIIAYPCNGGDRQKFFLHGEQIRSASGKCLSIDQTEREVVLADCNDRDDQQKWSKDGKFIKTKKSQKCFDLEGGLGGSNVIVYPCHFKENQQWLFGSSRLTVSRRECGCWGDPHCTDWIGRKFDYHGTGDFLLGDVDDYRVEADLYRCGASVSCIEAISIVSPSKESIEFSLKNKQPRSKCTSTTLTSGQYVDGMLVTNKGGNKWIVTAGHLEVTVVVNTNVINVYTVILGEIGDADVQGGFCTGYKKGTDSVSPDGSRRGWAGLTWSAAVAPVPKGFQMTKAQGEALGASWRLSASESHVCKTVENPSNYPVVQPPIPAPPTIEGAPPPVIEEAKLCCKVLSRCDELFKDCVLDHVVLAVNGVVKCVDQGDVTAHIEKCKNPPVDCVVSGWTAFSECSAKCGGGFMKRTRAITVQQKGTGQACPDTEESVPCNLSPCPINCVVDDWTALTPCSKSCGGGVSTRTRSVKVPEAFGGIPCPATFESQNCNENQCPVDCKVGVWGPFSECSVKCGEGVQRRTRSIVQVASFGGASCKATEDVQTCSLAPCPVDCKVSAWSDWSDCSTQCGDGVSSRSREVTILSANGGAECPPTHESVVCNLGECPRDCVISEWVPSLCSANCGGGVLTKTRSIIVNAIGDGAPCPSTFTTEPCNTDACPVGCQIGEWSEFSPCTATCGGGLKYRSRTIQQPTMGGTSCPEGAASSESQVCSTEDCCVAEPVCPNGRMPVDDPAECLDCLVLAGCYGQVLCTPCNKEPICPATHRSMDVNDHSDCVDCIYVPGCDYTVICTRFVELSLKESNHNSASVNSRPIANQGFMVGMLAGVVLSALVVAVVIIRKVRSQRNATPVVYELML